MAHYFRHKLQIDQNERFATYGDNHADHAATIDGHNGFVLATKTTFVKNKIIIYENVSG